MGDTPSSQTYEKGHQARDMRVGRDAAQPPGLSHWPCLPQPQADLSPFPPTLGGCRTAAQPRSWWGCRWPLRGPHCSSTTWSRATQASSPARPQTKQAPQGLRWSCLYTVRGCRVVGGPGGQGRWGPRPAAICACSRPGGDMGLVFSRQCFWAERGASS